MSPFQDLREIRDALTGLTPRQTLGRSLGLQELTAGLAGARSPEAVCEVIIERATLAAGGQATAAVWYLGSTGRAVLGAGSVSALAAVPPPDLRAFAASREHDPERPQPWLTESIVEALGAGDRADVRIATLLAGGELVGTLALGIDRTVEFDEFKLLGAIVRVSGEALARALAFGESLRLAAIVESSHDGMNLLGSDLTIVAWNRASERITGYSAEEAIGRTPAFLFPAGELDDEARAAFLRMRSGGGPERLIGERRRRDGVEITLAMTFSPVRDGQGELTGFAATLRDITRQVAAGRRARRLAAVVEASPDPLLIIDPAGTVVDCNPAAEEFFGRPAGELIGIDSATLATETDGDVFADLRRTVAGGEPLVRDSVPRIVSGTPRRLRMTGFPVRDERGDVIETAIIIHDVTSSERLAEALRQARSLESLGRLAGGVAHDFNNMLTVITGYAQIARRGGDDRRRAEAMDEISAAADRMQGLTRQLLAFARREPAAPALIDLHELVSALVPMLGRLIGSAVRIELDADGACGCVLADRAQLEQVVLNLVVNARDAMPDGGVVSISIGDRDDFVALSVTDTGHGIEPEVVDRIFEPFFSTKDPAQTAGESGSGLGLATVQVAVAAAGGTIEVQSRAGHGTTFTVLLPTGGPAARAPSEADADGHPLDGPADERGPACHVLVCDDEAPLLALLRGTLEDHGYAVAAFVDPKEAIAYAQDLTRRVDVLVTDMQMPGVSGRELATRVRAGRPGLPVVFASGFAPDRLGPGDPGGPNVMLDKPFDEAMLVRAIRGLMTADLGLK